MNIEQAIRILARDTSLEAVNELKYYAGFCSDKVIEQIQEAMDMGADALKKQIPKQIIKSDAVLYGTSYYCPECMSDITHVEFFRPDGSEPKEKVSYCWYCGQALKWGE